MRRPPVAVTIALWFSLVAVAAVTSVTLRAEDPPSKPVDFYQWTAAEKFNSRLTVPTFETTPEAVAQSATATLAEADQALDKIGRQDPQDAAFATTVGALDDVLYAVNTVAGRLILLKETSPDAKLRAAAEAALKRVQDWGVGAEYREDVYRIIQAYAKTEPKLAGEEAKLLAETLRDYRRAGLTLPAETRRLVEQERKELAALTTDFATHLANAVVPVVFTRAELEGVPTGFLDDPKVKTGDDAYMVAANEAYQYVLVQDNAKREDTRRKLCVARDNLAREQNVSLLNRILALRNSIALRLGYPSWADYQTEPKMARDAATANRFIDELIAGTQPKFDAEVAAMQRLKAADTNDPDTRVAAWDWRYYGNQLKKTRYNIDAEILRVYFPLPKVLEGMFKVYEQNFGLKFYGVEPPYRWVDDLQLYVATDAATGEPLGMFYLDLFPRAGKFNHFAQFSVVEGKQLPDGKYQRPTCALVCNFTPPRGNAGSAGGGNSVPSLLRHDEVVTVFHEFGHALHTMLTRARFGRFAGTNVPRDFVEAPSQMLENWAWDKVVLDSFAADYRDPSRKISSETLDRMREAKLATAGVWYRRQFAFAKLDLTLHGPHPAGEPYDAVAASNAVLKEVFLPIDEGTAFAAGFGHLAGGYDAGYYGYAWADRLAADLATVFRTSKKGFMDRDAGMRLRREIYEPGDSRDVNESVEKFLGRKPATEPFLENNLGLKKESPSSPPAGQP